MKLDHHLFVCTNQKSGVGEDLAKALKKELKKQHLKTIFSGGEKHKNRVQTCNCLDVCKHCKKGSGAAVVVYPEGIFYGDVKPDDAVDIVRDHLGAGQMVTRLLLD